MKASMRLAICVLGDTSKNDGTTVRAKRVFDSLKANHDCMLITRSKMRNPPIGVTAIGPARTRLWNFKLVPVILKNKFDAVYCSNDYFGYLTFFLFSKLGHTKLVFEPHGILSLEKEARSKTIFDELVARVFRRFEKFVIGHADHVVALSTAIYNYYKRFNLKISLIPVFLDESSFKAAGGIANRSREEDHRRTVGLVGPFNRMSLNLPALDFLYQNIDAFDRRIQFVIIGDCDERLANERFTYTGYLADEDYVDQLKRLDAVLVPAKIATYGQLNKILEPMACSLTVFTTRTGALGLDHITHGVDIFIFDEAELAQKVNSLIFDPDLLRSVGERARNTIEQYYSKAINEKKLACVIAAVD
jgi:glycosyltransferase involved in cell wall biosynthesis